MTDPLRFEEFTARFYPASTQRTRKAHKESCSFHILDVSLASFASASRPLRFLFSSSCLLFYPLTIYPSVKYLYGMPQKMSREPEMGLTFEKVWAMFQETDRKFKETDRQFKETDRKFKETDR
ncbi:MAG: hypothetical protein LBE14_04850, partial [Treponema sp.]|nr:hypothetical protein [Treponema sp.]